VKIEIVLPDEPAEDVDVRRVGRYHEGGTRERSSPCEAGLAQCCSD